MKLACPFCKTSLQSIESSLLYCEKCEREYLFENSLADFLGESQQYWGEIPRRKMREITEVVSVEGMQGATRWVEQNYPHLLDYVFNEKRIDWLFHCLNPSRMKSCLDVGSGWGTLTFCLAKHFEEVWSLESIPERIRLQIAARERLGYSNIRFCRADAKMMPFPDNSFDLVVANGVLEWMGVNNEVRNPRELQVEFLKEARRVLRNGGCLYIGIENRFGYQFFLGSRDHGGLPFTSLLPRKMSDVIVRLLSKRASFSKRNTNPYVGQLRYQTYTYNSKGYKRILGDAGFIDYDFYWVWPGYNYPTYAGRLDDFEGLEYLVKEFQTKKREMTEVGRFICAASRSMPRFLLRLFLPSVVPGFLIFAYKDKKSSTLEDKVIKSFPNGTFFLRAGGGSGATSKVNYWLLQGDKRTHIVKFPRFKSDLNLLETEEALLAKYTGINVKQENLDGFSFFVEENIGAANFDRMNPDHNVRTIEWLLDFQKQSKKTETIDLEVEINELNTFASEVLTKTEVRIPSLDKKREVSSVREHGDFWSGNILVGKRRIFVLDWEYYRDKGHPLFDFCFFTISNSVYGKDCQRTFEENLLGKGRYSSILSDILDLFCQKTPFDRSDIFYGIGYVLLRCKLRYLLRNVPELYRRFDMLLQRWIYMTGEKRITETSLWN